MMARRRSLPLLLLAVTAALLSSVAPVQADDGDPIVIEPPRTVSLSGTLSSEAGTLAGAWVSALQHQSSCPEPSSSPFCYEAWFQVGYAEVDTSTGAFTMQVPANTTVRLLASGEFIYPNAYGRTASTTAAGEGDGVDIVVADVDLTELDISALARPGIAGTITLPAAALVRSLSPDAQVIVYEYLNPMPRTGFSGKWIQRAQATFGADQLSEATSYRVALEPGTYRVSFSSYWTGTTFYGGSSLDDATDIVVTAEGVQTADFAPALLPQATGVITGPGGAALDDQIYVVLARLNPQHDFDALEPAYSAAEADGRFAFPISSAGDYILIAIGKRMFGIYGDLPACFATQGIDKTCLPAGFTIAGGGVSGLDFEMRWFPRITGTVTLPADADTTGLQASLERWAFEPGMDEGDEGHWAWQENMDSRADLVTNGDGTATVTAYVNEPGTFRIKFSGTWIAETAVGGDDEPNQDAFVFPSLLSPDQTFTTTLQASPIISGRVNLDIFGGKHVTAEVCVEYEETNGAWWGAGCFPVDTVTGDFRIAAPPGEFVISLSWAELDENGNSDYCDSCEIYYGSRDRDGAELLTTTSVGADNLYLDFPPATAPQAPTGAFVTAVGDGSVSVQWSPPYFDGDSPVTGYTARAVGTDASCTAPADEFTCTIEGLENLRRYTFEVVATNDIGDSEPADAGTATPHSNEFQVWLPEGGNVARDYYTPVWVFGAAGAASVSVRIGSETFEVYPDSNGVAVLDYYAGASSSGVRNGRLRVSARATVYDAEAGKQKLRASAMLYVPSTAVRTKSWAGSTLVARTRTAAPGTALTYVLDGDVVCEATADERGQASCAFTAPEVGEHWLSTVTLSDQLEPRQFDIDMLTVIPSGRRAG